ncbi:hypothetical protein DET59_10386 [Rossellomorea aquimaris]|uniref:Uncharacterized protein n=1 Tax=Rossellomorea aquimaris TaxID=189382 RepID=A0A366EW79_9BACI|nr:hypothetical protein DET59_10386 [Rossellomorea aquimaris]
MGCMNLRGNSGFENEFWDLKIKSVENRLQN